MRHSGLGTGLIVGYAVGSSTSRQRGEMVILLPIFIIGALLLSSPLGWIVLMIGTPIILGMLVLWCLHRGVSGHLYRKAMARQQAQALAWAQDAKRLEQEKVQAIAARRESDRLAEEMQNAAARRTAANRLWVEHQNRHAGQEIKKWLASLVHTQEMAELRLVQSIHMEQATLDWFYLRDLELSFGKEIAAHALFVMIKITD